MIINKRTQQVIDNAVDASAWVKLIEHCVECGDGCDFKHAQPIAGCDEGRRLAAHSEKSREKMHSNGSSLQATADELTRLKAAQK